MLSQAVLDDLHLYADSAIAEALDRGSNGMNSRPRSEVGMVAAVTLGALPEIGRHWHQRLRREGFRLNLLGVFCHAAPLVRFKKKCLAEECELADLLVVTDINSGAGTKRRAALIQAKMAARLNRVRLTGASSLRQLYLYQHWPDFTFADASYGTSSYCLSSGGANRSGTFGVIDRHLHSRAWPRWTQHPAAPTPRVVTTEPTLGRFLAEMVAGNRQGRSASIGGSDDWSKVVDLLLTRTYEKTFKHTPTLGNLTPPRGVSTFAFLNRAQNGLSGRDGGWRPPFDGIDYGDDIPPDGLSLLHASLSTE